MNKRADQIPVKRNHTLRHAPSLTNLRGDIDHLFENFMTGWPEFGRWPRSLSPDIDVSETETSYEIEAELPGLDKTDIELTLVDNILTLKGEKKDQREEKKKDYYLSERSYGSFKRSFTLPGDVDASRIDSRFSKGVLSITLPKSAEAQANTHKISIKTD